MVKVTVGRIRVSVKPVTVAAFIIAGMNRNVDTMSYAINILIFYSVRFIVR